MAGRTVTFQYAPGANSANHKTLFTRVQKSEFHDRCIPNEAREAAQVEAASGSGKRVTETEMLRRDPVSHDRVWKQSVQHEQGGAKQWKENWGFLSEFDERGEKKEPEPLPEKASIFSASHANTNSGNYGGRVTSELGQAMQKMEFNFSSHNRRKKLDADMVSY